MLPKPYYDEGGIQIFHGDCREILPHLPKVDLVLTDPPYGIGFAGQPTKWQRRAGAKPERWDDEAPDLALVIDAGEAACIWGGNYFSLPPRRGWMIWVKPDSPPSMGSVEMAWTSIDAVASHIVCSISQTNRERVGHPTQKPLKVMSWCMARLPGETILDPFMGSGTTLVAAKNLGRKAIGIEIEEKYCEIAVDRLRQGVLL